MDQMKQEVKTEVDAWLHEWSSQDNKNGEITDTKFSYKIEQHNKEEVHLKFGAAKTSKKADTENKRHEENENKIGDFCKYECPTCKWSFCLWTSLLQHFRKKPDCKASTTKSCLVKTVMHKCLVCNKEILNDSSKLSGHVKIHGLTVQGYCEQYAIERSVRDITYADVLRNAKKYQKLTFSDRVGNLCEFKCTECPKTFKTFDVLQRHERMLNHVHGTRPESFSKVVFHKCKICKTNLINDGHFLVPHMREKHNMKLSAYASNFKLGKENQRDKLYERVKEVTKGAKISKDVGNMCQWRCNVCHAEFTSLIGLDKHMRSTSHGPSCCNVSAVEKYAKKVVVHICCMCRKIVISDRIFLASHIKTHGLGSLEEYCKSYGLTQVGILKKLREERCKQMERATETSPLVTKQCEFICPSCKTKFNSWRSMLAHLHQTGHVKPGRGAFEKCIVKYVFHQCRLCGTKVISDGRMLTNHFGQFHKGMTHAKYERLAKEKDNGKTYYSKIVEDLCEYKCSQCEIVLKSWTKMSEHLRESSHGKETYQAGRDLLSKHVVHKCEICGKDLRCERDFVKGHLHGSHNIGLKDYRERYGIPHAMPNKSRCNPAEKNLVINLRIKPCSVRLMRIN